MYDSIISMKIMLVAAAAILGVAVDTSDYTSECIRGYDYTAGYDCNNTAEEYSHGLFHTSHYHDLIQQQWLLYPTDANDSSTTTPSSNCITPFDAVIQDDLSVWMERGGISKQVFDDSTTLGVHYQIIDHKLYRQRECMFESRCRGVEYFISKIINQLPTDVELIINVFDWPKSLNRLPPKPVFSFSKNDGYHDIMYPAWTFWSGGPAIITEPTGLGRWDLKRIALRKTSSDRDPLILLSRNKPYLLDAAYTRNQAWKSIKDTLYAEPADIIRLEDHCKYKYLFNFRGVAASFRYKHLFLCNSLVFNVQSEWKEFFYDSLKPWVHYIPVNDNCSHTENLLEFAKDNDKISKTIAVRGFNFIWKNLTPENIECYWRNIITEYSKLTKWIPKRNDDFILLT